MNLNGKWLGSLAVSLTGLVALLTSQSVSAHIPGVVRNPRPSNRPVAGPIKPNATVLGIDPDDPSSFELLRYQFQAGWSTPVGLFPRLETQAIFWGPEWQSANFAGDRITGLDDFYSGLDGSQYLAALKE